MQLQFVRVNKCNCVTHKCAIVRINAHVTKYKSFAGLLPFLAKDLIFFYCLWYLVTNQTLMHYLLIVSCGMKVFCVILIGKTSPSKL